MTQVLESEKRVGVQWRGGAVWESLSHTGSCGSLCGTLAGMLWCPGLEK